MQIIKRRKIENLARCEYCGTELKYDMYDLNLAHTEENYYYIICPLCGGKIWLQSTPKLDKLYHEAYEKRNNNK